jgi:hypothetical protein
MKQISSCRLDASAGLALAQAEYCIANMGQALLDADTKGVEHHANALLKSLVATKSTLAATLQQEDLNGHNVASDQDKRASIRKALVKMSLQLQQQRELLMRKSSMVDRQLDSLLPPVSRLTYDHSKGPSTARFGTNTFFKA